MHVRASETFNYGGIVKMSSGDKREVDDELAKKMIEQGLVKEYKPSYKTIKIKKDVNTINKTK